MVQTNKQIAGKNIYGGCGSSSNTISNTETNHLRYVDDTSEIWRHGKN